MKITNEPIEENSPIKFIVTGFPVEESIRSAVERFYKIKPDADRRFMVHNEFKEAIFSGQVDEHGKVAELIETPRTSKL